MSKATPTPGSAAPTVAGLATFPLHEQEREAAQFGRSQRCLHLSRTSQVINGQRVLTCTHCWVEMTGWRVQLPV